MMRTMLLERTKIGEFLSMEANSNSEDIDLIIYSVDVASNCVFQRDEWQEFVKNVNKIDQAYQKLAKKK